MLLNEPDKHHDKPHPHDAMPYKGRNITNSQCKNRWMDFLYSPDTEHKSKIASDAMRFLLRLSTVKNFPHNRFGSMRHWEHFRFGSLRHWPNRKIVLFGRNETNFVTLQLANLTHIIWFEYYFKLLCVMESWPTQMRVGWGLTCLINGSGLVWASSLQNPLSSRPISH